MFCFVQHRGEAIAEPTVLAGSLPLPAVSSRSRGWKGLVVERYRGVSADVMLRSPAVLVTVEQPRDRRVGSKSLQRLNQGDTPGREISVTPSGEVCRWSHGAGETWTALWLDPALLDRVVAASSDAHPGRAELLTLRRSADAPIEAMADSLIAELESEQNYAGICVESIALRLAVHLLRHYSRLDQSEPIRVPALPPAKLRRASEYINAHLGEDLTLAEIARIVGMSPCHFARRFKQATGVAPHHYLMVQRIEAAKSLLRETDLPITEIAHRVGCVNQSHFSTLFHRAEAMSPRAFREHC